MDLSLSTDSEHFSLRPKQTSVAKPTRVIDVNWSQYFPLQLSQPDDKVEVVDYERVVEFIKKNFDQIYYNEQKNEAGRFLKEEFADAKRRYYDCAGDFFAFTHKGEIVGTFAGSFIDWSSYYFRNCSILPAFQGGGRYQQLLRHLISILGQNGIDRIEGDVAPSNLGHIHVLNKLKFNITGFNLSERWGALVKFTHFTNARPEKIFLDQFCDGVKPQLRTINE